MELTKSEMEIADRYISKRERQLEQWPRRRWLMLAIFSVLALLGYGILSDGDRSIRDDKAMDMQVSQALEKDPPPGLEHRWAVGCMMKISKILELPCRKGAELILAPCIVPLVGHRKTFQEGAGGSW